MKLTRTADYAMRLLISLATNEGTGTVKAKAKELDVPANHLVKVVHSLSKVGLLLTKKGKGGGFKLAFPPSKIRVSEVIEATEGPLIVSDCLFHPKGCGRSKSCPFRKFLLTFRADMQKTLYKKTISDFIA
ncbi:hypothetical protein A2230_00555 [candidate division WOR-1 bacterium RIFOXYA2_FULL_36_21]|uniref:Rrf2 family transcriptional regulator n=1 Tax=candidate division WOR-1 bacterium RIFOXYB2_FULL_36_35 TaxID=1802578 RepID=A0A1F4RXE2_UNCSA|nr:MAG: hypothetical protein A2230_00555 [candidate division WOR-1 bacterium RIFOXYA2_FULL_36_21]OGC12841.1 MAG: hypothetical protein A2290_06615 [candidate division WOR-1 bacterium RIFOXYB2_FULL_36_35]